MTAVLGRVHNRMLQHVLQLEDVVRAQDPQLQKTDGRKARWFIRPYVDGFDETGKPCRRQERVYLGRCDEMTKRQAMVEKARVMALINRSQYMAASQLPFGELLDEYLKRWVWRPGALAASTVAKYETHIRNHIRPAFGDLPLAAIDTRTVDAWLASKSRLSWATRQDLKNLLSGIFSKASDWGIWREPNPALRASAGRKRAVWEKRKLTLDQTRALLAALRPDVSLMCQVMLFCTLRISECLGLEVRHVDIERGVLMIRQRSHRGEIDVVKSERARRDVPLGHLVSLVAALAADRLPNEFLFELPTYHRGGRERVKCCRDDRDLNQHFLRPVAKALGIYYKGFGFHAFRREAITSLLSSDVGQAMKVAGHANVRMSEVYALSDLAKQDAAIRRHQELVLGLSQNEPVETGTPQKGVGKELKVKEKSGGLDRIRICDLYRVKVG